MGMRNSWRCSERTTSKYGSRETEVDGIRFDSRKEARRYAELRLMEKAGEISMLERQVPFQLIPAQRDAGGKVIERAVNYMADFVYITRNGKRIVEDVKGYRTEVYKIKKKLMLHVYGIRIQEV